MIEPQIPRLLRLKQILGDPKADPPVEPIIPISKSSWWDGISKGKYPKPIKLGENTTCSGSATRAPRACVGGTRSAGGGDGPLAR